jgi:hypothetical protein
LSFEETIYNFGGKEETVYGKWHIAFSIWHMASQQIVQGFYP